MHNNNNNRIVTLETILTCYNPMQIQMQTQCRWYQNVTKSHTLIHHHPDIVIIDSSIIIRTRIQPHHPSSPGYSYWQYKSNSTQWKLTSPECICMHNTSMQHSTQVMTTSDIINHHQPQHDIITYHEINHHKA